MSQNEWDEFPSPTGGMKVRIIVGVFCLGTATGVGLCLHIINILGGL